MINKLESALELLNKEEFCDYYYNHTSKEVLQKFNITYNALKKLRKY